MTDLLLKPEDTGEIPTETGLATQNLKPYVGGLPPAMRRPNAVLDLIGEFATVPPEPMPVPPTTSEPKVDELWEEAEAPPYVGRHRKPSRWDWLTVPLAMAVQRIGRAL